MKPIESVDDLLVYSLQAGTRGLQIPEGQTQIKFVQLCQRLLASLKVVADALQLFALDSLGSLVSWVGLDAYLPHDLQSIDCSRYGVASESLIYQHERQLANRVVFTVWHVA
jgi:hypothetical protein